MPHIIPPPWELTGNGLVLLYRFPRDFASPWIPSELHNMYVGGFGAVMCVDYHTSNVGPYRELLFIPGMFRVGRRIGYTITRIFVSTEISVDSGRANWAIPKRKADFFVGRDMQHVHVERQGQPFFNIDCEAVGPFYPANTDWLPLHPELIQQDERGRLVTRPSGRGALRRLRTWRVSADCSVFPDISRFRPLFGFAASNFTLAFPQPEQVEA